MNWIDNINNVIDYVEANLTNNIDYDEVERIMACSKNIFHQTFNQISDVTLTEYIRRRKLTLAAYNLQNTSMKVIDVALKYGYTSPDAFRVAFKNMHLINPSEAKQLNKVLKFYSRLHFEIKIKGVSEMDYKLVKVEGFRVVGKRAITPYAGGTWAIVKSDGTLDTLKKLAKTENALGLCFGFDDEGNNDYMCGVELDAEVPGYEIYDYPELNWLVFVSEGKISENVLSNTWARIKNDFMPNTETPIAKASGVLRYINFFYTLNYLNYK